MDFIRLSFCFSDVVSTSQQNIKSNQDRPDIANSNTLGQCRRFSENEITFLYPQQWRMGYRLCINDVLSFLKEELLLKTDDIIYTSIQSHLINMEEMSGRIEDQHIFNIIQNTRPKKSSKDTHFDDHNLQDDCHFIGSEGRNIAYHIPRVRACRRKRDVRSKVSISFFTS